MDLTNPAVAWLVLIIVLLAIEIATLNLTTIWFAGGAAAAFICTFFGLGIQMQCTAFVLVSLILLAATRPLAMRYMRREPVRTNADSLIGRTACASKEIDNEKETGEVLIADVSWTARSLSDDCVILKGSRVRICAIEGVKLIVEELKEEN